MVTQRDLTREANHLAKQLQHHDLRIVFAESCTGGLISASLTRVPGISAWHCGSAVVYRVETKARWLGISRDILKKPGPVSRVVAAAMAEGVLAKTPEANIAASITGHLGPDAPPRLDGLIYVGIALKTGPRRSDFPKTVVLRHRLPKGNSKESIAKLRSSRQMQAAEFVLQNVSVFLEKTV